MLSTVLTTNSQLITVNPYSDNTKLLLDLGTKICEFYACLMSVSFLT
jgi:hypothetical protein